MFSVRVVIQLVLVAACLFYASFQITGYIRWPVGGRLLIFFAAVALAGVLMSLTTFRLTHQ